MDGQQLERHEASSSPARRACLVDARIVSHRRAAFFSAWAKDHGEGEAEAPSRKLQVGLPSHHPVGRLAVITEAAVARCGILAGAPLGQSTGQSEL